MHRFKNPLLDTRKRKIQMLLNSLLYSWDPRLPTRVYDDISKLAESLVENIIRQYLIIKSIIFPDENKPIEFFSGVQNHDKFALPFWLRPAITWENYFLWEKSIFDRKRSGLVFGSRAKHIETQGSRGKTTSSCPTLIRTWTNSFLQIFSFWTRN